MVVCGVCVSHDVSNLKWDSAKARSRMSAYLVRSSRSLWSYIWCPASQEVLVCRITHFEWSLELGFTRMCSVRAKLAGRDRNISSTSDLDAWFGLWDLRGL
jgi:hypothetical protein